MFGAQTLIPHVWWSGQTCIKQAIKHAPNSYFECVWPKSANPMHVKIFLRISFGIGTLMNGIPYRKMSLTQSMLDTLNLEEVTLI